MTIIESIIARHSHRDKVFPGEIVDVEIDVRLARDFGGANVVKNLVENGLSINKQTSTFFTFDCNPTGSDQKYAANQQICRQFARENMIKVFDIDAGIGTHLSIDKGLAVPGGTLVSTDSHANILGAIGCFGQGMGDQDIAAAWAKGAVWFKVPETVKITLVGDRPKDVYAKDIILNLLQKFGTISLLGVAIELYGKEVDNLSLDERITISSMATEMGAIILFIAPNDDIIRYCLKHSGKEFTPVFADENAQYAEEYIVDISEFLPRISLPGKPHYTVPVNQLKGTEIDSVFIGSCTNGRIEDLRIVAKILNGRKIAPGVVLKIVPATDEIWQQSLDEGLIHIFKDAGALVSNAGCAGCASGQVGQNGPGEKTLSTGNRNFTGKQGKGEVYLSSPAIAAATAIAGYITTPDEIPDRPEKRSAVAITNVFVRSDSDQKDQKPDVLTGKVWLIPEDNIDTDMIFHNRHLAITEVSEMGRFAFGNLEGWESFSDMAQPGDIIITGRNFGSGSSRQQAVDCFKALGIHAILARSFGAIYERNAINSGLPVLVYDDLDPLDLKLRDEVVIDLKSSMIINKSNGKQLPLKPIPEVQLQIYMAGGILNLKG